MGLDTNTSIEKLEQEQQEQPKPTFAYREIRLTTLTGKDAERLDAILESDANEGCVFMPITDEDGNEAWEIRALVTDKDPKLQLIEDSPEISLNKIIKTIQLTPEEWARFVKYSQDRNHNPDKYIHEKISSWIGDCEI